MKEYTRFGDVFFKSWSGGSKLIASLPGNHDLGFASRIQMPVKERFDAYFGPLNRMDVVGNHTFVSIDSVSLSAMDEADPLTGATGRGDGSGKKPNGGDMEASTGISGQHSDPTRASSDT